MRNERHKKRTYVESVRHVTAETFQKWSNNVAESVVNNDGAEQEVLKLPALFCAIRYINDAKYFQGDATVEAERLNKQEENNVQFLQRKAPSSTK